MGWQRPHDSRAHWYKTQHLWSPNERTLTCSIPSTRRFPPWPHPSGLLPRLHNYYRILHRHIHQYAWLPAKYWSSALQHSVYLHNRLVHKVTKKTPFESLYGIKPDIGHLKLFGSRVSRILDCGGVLAIRRYPKLAHNLVYHPIATMSTMGFWHFLGAPLPELLLCAPFLGVHPAALVAAAALALLARAFSFVHSTQVGGVTWWYLEWVPSLCGRDIPKLCNCNNQKDVTLQAFIKIYGNDLKPGTVWYLGDLSWNKPYFRSLNFIEYLGFLFVLIFSSLQFVESFGFCFFLAF